MVDLIHTQTSGRGDVHTKQRSGTAGTQTSCQRAKEAAALLSHHSQTPANLTSALRVSCCPLKKGRDLNNSDNQVKNWYFKSPHQIRGSDTFIKLFFLLHRYVKKKTKCK